MMEKICMNLYFVYPYNDEWCCYVFAETRNKAKTMILHYFTDDDYYIDYGCRIIYKNVDGISEVCDEDCERLKLYGIKYNNEYL
jgi:hypothetical protein